MYIVSADDSSFADLLLDAEVVLEGERRQVRSRVHAARILEVADERGVRGRVVGLGSFLVLMEHIEEPRSRLLDRFRAERFEGNSGALRDRYTTRGPPC